MRLTAKLLLIALCAPCCARGPSSLIDSFDRSSERVQLGGESREALNPVFPSRMEATVEVPPRSRRPRLRFSFAVESSAEVPRARVGFRVRVIADGFPVTIHDQVLRVADHNRWHDQVVDLAAWAGKRVSLSLETYPALTEGPIPWKERIHAVWGDPEIAVGEPPPQLPPARSVILIVIDTLRYDYLGVDGFVGDVTPHLDWLAMESTRFENAIATAPWTRPSVASLLTGLYPETHGVGRLHPGAGDSLSSEAVTLAETLHEQGYETAAFVGNGLLAPPYGFDQGFDTFVFQRKDDVLLEKVRSWLSGSHREPYFLYLHLIEAHGPYRAPERDYLALESSPSLGPDRALTPADPVRPAHLDMTPFASVSETHSLRAWKGKYAAAIHHVDRRLGALLNELRATGELDRGLVIFTSDHGEEFLEHGSWEHGYEQCIHELHVPLWIRRPGAEGAGNRITEVVSLVDVMPTVLALTGAAVPAGLQGEDRSLSITGDAVPGTDGVAFSSATLGRPELHSLWTDRYHLLRDTATGATELFDLERDPQELESVAESDPKRVSRLAGRLTIHRESMAASGSLRGERVVLPAEIRDQLQELGYIR